MDLMKTRNQSGIASCAFCYGLVGWLVGRYLGSPHLFLSLFHFVALGPSLNTCIFILNDEGINISTVSSSFLSNMHGNEATHNTS